jgi:hypothetical protein
MKHPIHLIGPGVFFLAVALGCSFDPDARLTTTTGGGAGAGGPDAGVAGSAGGKGGNGGAAGRTGSGAAGGASGLPGAGGGTVSGAGVGGADGGWSGGSNCDPNGPKCNNCKDDDNDGLIDAADPECIGPLDNDEATFATGVPGDNVDACKQDCFFDGNSGQGDDGCDWNLKCDPASPGARLSPACPYDASYHNCPTGQSQICLDTCRSVTPNGCDCFGCCLVPGASHPIYLAPTCSAADFNDPTKCPACTQVPSCLNTCEHCEICVGKTTLPSDCSVPPLPTGSGGAGGGGAGGSGGTSAPCNGATYCGPGGVDPLSCPAGTWCVTGCCITAIG